MTLTSLQIHHN